VGAGGGKRASGLASVSAAHAMSWLVDVSSATMQAKERFLQRLNSSWRSR